MLTPAFVREMLLTSTETSVDTAIRRMNEQLWPYTGAVLRRKSTIGSANVPLADPVTLVDNVVDVIGVLFDGVFLPRADETRLDAFQPNWRVAPASVPHSFLFSGEVLPGFVQLFPAPTQVVDVNLLVLLQPPLEEIVPWNRLYVALRTTSYIASSDPVRARLGLKEFLDPLITLVEANVHGL